MDEIVKDQYVIWSLWCEDCGTLHDYCFKKGEELIEPDKCKFRFNKKDDGYYIVSEQRVKEGKYAINENRE